LQVERNDSSPEFSVNVYRLGKPLPSPYDNRQYEYFNKSIFVY